MTRQVLFFAFLLFGALGWGQTQIYVLDFETSGGYTTSMSERTDDGSDYFTRTDGSDISGTYNNPIGTYFFAAQDLDADDMSSPATLTIDDINIAGYTNLELRVYLAEDDASDGDEDWDDSDYLHIDYDIDNSGTFTNGIWVENDGSTYNSAPFIDSDYDGVGDGAEITDTFTQFTKSITGTGSTIDIKITFGGLTSSDEDIAIDHIEIYGESSGPLLTINPTSLTGFTYVEGNGPSAEQSFTVEGSNLTGDITVTPPANWEIATASGGPYHTSAITLTQSGGTVGTTTIYTRMVAGLSHGTYSGNIVCSTDDGSGDTITENVAVDGSVTYSNASDIIANSGFSYTVNIPYVDYQADPITNSSESVGVFKFDIRDGGGSADSDALGTELTDITFSVGSTHAGYIRSAALFDGNTHLADGTVDAVTGEITFTGLSGADFTAPDDGTKSLTLRVSFTTNVTDNEQLQFTVISATANNSGSVFAAADAGGAQSAVTGDKNRIEVVADRLIFGQQPTTTIKNEVMSPAVTVKGVDVYQNLDLDFEGDVSITSLGTMTGDPITVTVVNGVATFDNIVHTVAETDLFLEASCSGFTAVDSDKFDIVDFIYEAGDFRPKRDTDFSYNGDWEYYDGSSWGNVPDGKAPQNTTETINRIIINKNVTGGGSSGHSYDCDIIIFNNGQLTLNDDDPTPDAEFITGDHKLEVLNGGKLVIQGDIDLASTVDFILRNGAYMLIDQNSIVNNHPMWDGDELFEGGSTVEIRDWDWSASPSVRSLINVITTISDNANGYKFGKIYFNPTNLADTWTIVGGGVNVKVTENDFQINNPSSNYVAVMSNKTAGISTEFGGDLVIDDGPFTFGSSYSTDDFDQTIIVKGDLLVGTDDDIYLHKAFSGTPTIAEGNGQIQIHSDVEIWQLGSNVLTSDVDTKQILLTGDNDHTLFIERTCENMPLIIEGGDSVELVNSNLKFAGNSSITIQSNATFNFGFDGNTALKVQSVSGTGNKFIQEGGAYLYITHPQGIWDASSNGNVQDFAASNTTYTQTNSTYHYIGKENQETGDAFTSGSTSKTIICELDNNTDELTVTATTGTSSALEIRSGIVVNTEGANIYGSGDLIISNGGLKTGVLGTTGDVPLLSGTFNITEGFVELNAADDQSLKGSIDYKDLIFSNAGTKTITSAIQNIDGTITIKDDAILDVESHQMGGAGTDLTMTNNAIFKIDGTSGTGVKPDAQGTYNLGTGTKIIFQNSGSTLQRIRLFRDYYNIDIEGANVGTEAISTPIRIQLGGSFSILSGGKFSFINTTGFNGGTDTAIDNTNNPTITLETGSTIEYAGDNQTITDFTPGYQNLKISGNDTKTLFDNGDPNSVSLIKVNENLELISSTLRIENEKSISVDGDVTNTGEIIVENTGSLVQTGETATIRGDGIYTLNKTSLPLNNYYDYVYWSSPLNSTTLTLGDILTGAWRYYEYDNSYQPGATYPYWRYLTSDHIVERGRGYAVSAPAGSGTNNSITLNVSFTKGNDPFNTGSFDFTLSKHGSAGGDAANYNLIGNPYPSAIDFDALYNDNTSALEGNYSLWTNCAGLDGNQHHQASGYSTYVVAGGNGTATSTCSDSNRTAGRYIATGQGFMVEAKADNVNLSFKNSQRVAGNNTGFMNRPATQNRDIMWLDMFNNSGQFSQIAIGFYPGATDQYDSEYDAHSQNAGSGFSLYSLLDNHKLVIQGLAYNQADDKVIPLGVESDVSGTVTFHLNHTEGFDNRDIFIKDNDLNVIHDLKNTDYTVNVSAGLNHNRFEIIFSRALDVETLQANDNQLIVRQNSDRFDVYFKIEKNISRIQVYDITGRVIFNKKSLNTNLYSIDFKHIATGNMLIFKVIDTDNHMYIKKLIKQ